MFENWLGSARGKRMQLMFYDDYTFEIREVDVKESSLVVKGPNNEIAAGWPAINLLAIPFKGLGKIKPCMLTMCLESDIIYDPFDAVKEEDKPEKGDTLVKKFIQKKAETIRYRHQAKPGESLIMGKVTMWLGITLVMQMLILGIVVAF